MAPQAAPARPSASIDARMWAGVRPDRPGDGGGHAAHASTCYLPGGLIEGTRRPRQRAHRRLHGAGVRAALQLLQRALGDARAPSSTCSSTAGCGARSRCRVLLQVAVVHVGVPQRRVRHRAARRSAQWLRVRRDGQRGAVGRASCASCCTAGNGGARGQDERSRRAAEQRLRSPVTSRKCSSAGCSLPAEARVARRAHRHPLDQQLHEQCLGVRIGLGHAAPYTDVAVVRRLRSLKRRARIS